MGVMGLLLTGAICGTFSRLALTQRRGQTRRARENTAS